MNTGLCSVRALAGHSRHTQGVEGGSRLGCSFIPGAPHGIRDPARAGGSRGASWGCPNRPPQTGWLKQAHACSLTDLETTSLKARCQRPQGDIFLMIT